MSRNVHGLHAAAVFLSGFLLFLVQPLVAKAILPWFGGAAGVWATALVFYQSLLLAGYAYAHWTSTRAPARQAWVHAALLLLSLLWLPVLPDEAWKPTGPDAPGLRVLGLLAATVAGPYLVLASSSPLLQTWRARDGSGRSPYRLYAVSNAGSLAGLFAYPLLLEPWLTVPGQAFLWSGLYAGFAVLSGWLGFRAARPRGESAGGPEAVGPEAAGPGPSARTLPVEEAAQLPGGSAPDVGSRFRWALYAGCGAALLVAVTNQITMDVASIPFLWILPLALYLVTWILAFAGWYRRIPVGLLLLASMVGLMVVAMLALRAPLWSQIGAGLAALFAACLVCHGELAARVPAARHLTAFYLWTGAGGALGGALVALVAPALLSDFWELPGLLLLAYGIWLAALVGSSPARVARRRRLLVAAACAATLWAAGAGLARPLLRRSDEAIVTERNFYGVLRVTERMQGTPSWERRLTHGRVLHGSQFLQPGSSAMATTYYAPRSGIDVALRRHSARAAARPLRVGVMGLGTGTIAALAEPGDTLRFFEINPAVEGLARRWFTYLDRPATEVVLGEGRLSLERELRAGQGGRYDVLAIDAFSGDAIPVHLLTREAMAVYARALAADGVLAVHVSNRYLDLGPVVLGMAAAAGMEVLRVDRPSTPSTGGAGSTWYLLSADAAFLEAAALAPGASRVPESEGAVVWTDGFSNLLGVLG